MKRSAIILLCGIASLVAQNQLAQTEQESLQRAIAEAGNSPVEFARAIEHHLQQFPKTSQRAELERALVKTSIDLNDDRRVVQYGDSVLAREPDNLQFLEPVITALLRTGDKSSAERSLGYARHLEQLFQANYKNDKLVTGGGREVAKRKDESDRAQARVLILQARAQGLLDHHQEATLLAASSYKIFPSVEGAREAARWLSAAGKDREAIQYLADAFTIGGPRSSDIDGNNDRARLGELYVKLNGNEKGLGDLILKAYDDTAKLLAARRAELRQYDLNAQLKDPMQFTLSGLEGDKLVLSSLLGKVTILDFWATWCGPCRAQHVLYEEVKARFKDSGDVVFLSIDTDEDRLLVKPFVESLQWTQKIYFDDGLANLLQVSNIPTTIIFGKKGEVASRMIGFLPDRFVDMLSDRIGEALGRPPVPPPAARTLSQ